MKFVTNYPSFRFTVEHIGSKMRYQGVNPTGRSMTTLCSTIPGHGYLRIQENKQNTLINLAGSAIPILFLATIPCIYS
jgi:hypothetical protein